MEVLVQPLNRRIRVEPGANLLQALLDAQVPMSHSCMAGRCGTCRCRVLEGEVMAGAGERSTLEGDSGVVLACQTYVTEPCTIEIAEPDEVIVHPARIVKATVTTIEELTHDVRRLVLKLAKPVAHSPGQYVQVQFDAGHARPYSMAGWGRDDEFEFHVRVVPDGRVSGYVARQLRVGDAVKLSGPLVCVAGGTGLAPILSILRGALAHGMRQAMHLYVGVRSPRDLYGLDWIAHLQAQHPGLRVDVVVAAGGDPAVHRPGLVTDAIAQDHQDLAGWRAYLCGSPPMVEAATRLVRRCGVPAAHIHADAFYPQVA